MTSKIKPNLLDPKIEREISQSLGVVHVDYWNPIKRGTNYIYQKVIRKNLLFFIIFGAVVIFLIFRYFRVKKNKSKKSSDTEKIDNNEKQEIDKLLEMYRIQKENMREPIIDHPHFMMK